MNVIQEIDRELLHFFNGSNSLFVDSFATTLTSTLTWLPLFVALLYLVIKSNEDIRGIAYTIGAISLCLIFCGGLIELVIKPLVGRYRPTLDPEIKYSIEIIRGIRSSNFSFFSGHAANTFSIAVFFSLLVKDRYFSTILILWSLINCWTRLYLAVHYTTDILTGLVWGGLIGATSFIVYKRQRIPNTFNKKGIHLVINSFYLSLILAIIYSIINI